MAMAGSNRPTLQDDGGHQKYVAVVRGPTAVPLILVGAWTPDSGVATQELFMVGMDLETAREYGRRILDACDLIDADAQEAAAHLKQ